jgi:hypothetical protein
MVIIKMTKKIYQKFLLEVKVMLIIVTKKLLLKMKKRKNILAKIY